MTMNTTEMGLGLGSKNHDDLEHQDCRDVFEDPITDYSEGEDSDSDDDDDNFVCCNPALSCGVGFDGIDNIDPTSKFKVCESVDLRKGSSKVLWERRKGLVLMEGFVEEPVHEEVKGSDEGGDVSKSVSRTKSLTDDDLDELKGCLDLGFGFSYEEIPELCNTLPALELCYSISQKFQDEQQKFPPVSIMDGEKDKDKDREIGVSDAYSSSSNSSCTQSPIANWKISSPGDHPEEVKARLKFWAQAVACTIRLCS